jgi:hypothetical protein
LRPHVTNNPYQWRGTTSGSAHTTGNQNQHASGRQFCTGGCLFFLGSNQKKGWRVLNRDKQLIAYKHRNDLEISPGVNRKSATSWCFEQKEGSCWLREIRFGPLEDNNNPTKWKEEDSILRIGLGVSSKHYNACISGVSWNATLGVWSRRGRKQNPEIKVLPRYAQWELLGISPTNIRRYGPAGPHRWEMVHYD